MADTFRHIPVLLNETIEGLNIKEDGLYVDGTLGGGGHSEQILRRLGPGGRLIGIDQDRDALAFTGKKLEGCADRLTLIHSNFAYMPMILDELGIKGVDGILLDLGVSSYQLDTAQRGFSDREEAPLDMRMDRDQEKTAFDIVNGYTETELYHIIRDYGEEKFAKNIAKHIAAARESEPIRTTTQLAQIVKESIPMKQRIHGGHPAKRTFQAIRIELNSELDVLQNSLEGMVRLLNDGGRICVITFHSLEDRIVKRIFNKCENPCTCPPSFPVCVCGKKPLGRVITRKPVFPSEEEMEYNSRSKSAKLRIFERKILS